MFYRWGAFAYRHRVITPLVLVAALLALFFFSGTKLEDRLDQEGWDDPGSDSTAAAMLEEETFGRDNSGDVVVLVDAPDGATVDDPELTQRVNDHFARLQAENPEYIAHVTSYFANNQAVMATEDKQTAFVAIGLTGTGNDVLKNYRAIEDQLPIEGVDMEIAGATPVAGALDSGMADDIWRAELIGLPIVALLLLIVFGGVVSASMPLIVGILSIAGSLGILSMLASVTQVNAFAQSVVTLLGLGLAIDYGLFMVSRFREEMAEGVPVPRAVANTTATAGKTVVFSAAMVAVALSGLLLFPQAFLKSVAYGAMSAVGLAALLSLTVLPALFGLLGPNIDRWSVRRAGRTREQSMNSVWGRIPAWAMKHATAVTIAVSIGLLALTLPLIGIKFGGINETYLPPANETRTAQERFDENFPTMRTDPVKLVIEDGGNPRAVGEIYQRANEVAGLTDRFKIAQPTKDGVTVLSAGIENREDGTRIVEQLRGIDVPDGATVFVGGTPAMEVESIEALFDTLPWMILYMVVATFILMALVFGSIILPAKAVIMTALGLGATLGILTAMFVDGVGAGLFGFTPGPLMSPVLVLIIAIIYGLSTDYEVFLVSRMVEDRDAGAATPHAIRFGTANTGGIITAAALIMIVVAGAFGFSDIVMMKYIAFGMIAALFLDATIIRLLLVPAVMKLLGDDCWWAPRWVKRLSAHLGHGSAAPAPVARVPAMAGAPAEAHADGLDDGLADEHAGRFDEAGLARGDAPAAASTAPAVPAMPERTETGEPIYEGELVDDDPAAGFIGHDPDDDLVARYAGDGAADDGYGDAVPDDEPIQVPEGRLTVRDIMLRLEWEKREALGPGSPGPDSGTADNR
ncbi:MMPL family transporter [Corynebacterium freneyi]|uniref:RND superfamily putative drug exporter n=1 Tax=Corynebacterium freneyi TaxID=134034 RepID=A0ABS4U5I4_9CORY|nr:MMPL family transporter [Corynebacterium freneyi]MBP2331479.1 RND superfamily putative drug exporter [Corynebacterium freneyi]QXA52049.1 MMPL family transporter [Corynebacterium freneyi]WJZ06398.1 Membrane protein YdfJ [Corynebacterium freneyi]